MSFVPDMNKLRPNHMNIDQRFIRAIKNGKSVKDPSGLGMWKNVNEENKNFFQLKYQYNGIVFVFQLSFWITNNTPSNFDLDFLTENDDWIDKFYFPYTGSKTPASLLMQLSKLIPLLSYCTKEILKESIKWVGDGYERDYNVLVNNLKNASMNTMDCVAYIGPDRTHFKLRNSDKELFQKKMLGLIKKYQVKGN